MRVDCGGDASLDGGMDRAGLRAFEQVLAAAEAGGKDEEGVAVALRGACAAADLQAVHVRLHPVAHHHVHARVGPVGVPGFWDVLRQQALVAELLDGPRDYGAGDRVVLADQDLRLLFANDGPGGRGVRGVRS